MGEIMMDTFTVKIRATERAWALGVAEQRAEEYFGHPGATLFTVSARYLKGVYHPELDARYEFTFTYRGNCRPPLRVAPWPRAVRPCIHCGDDLWEDQFHNYLDGEGVTACWKRAPGGTHTPEGRAV